MRYEVNAGIRLATVVAPVRPTDDFIELVLESRISAELIHHQLLKRDAVLGLRLILTQLIQNLRELRHK